MIIFVDENDENKRLDSYLSEITPDFSRSKIPYERNFDIAKFYKHIGIYAYKRESLFKMTKFSQPEIEQAESLEQLRALYNCMKIKTSIVEYNSIGIDTIEDLNEFKKIAEKK